MGQTLSEPLVDKKSEAGRDERCAYGISSMQGWRISMEDAHACILDLQPAQEGKQQQPATAEQRITFFGVYDGHGGERVAIYTGQHLHEIISKQDAFKNGHLEQALKDGFLAIDRSILNDPSYENEVSGCTATVAICTNDKIYVGNSGDSRTVLGVKGRAKPLSFDHKPQNEGEKGRITAAGGFVEFGRVNGNLALSRAIGDFEFKKSAELPPEQQIVTAFPDVTVHELSDDDEFLVLACDGIWDCQSSQAVVEFVRRGIAARQDLESICENMMDNCLAPSCDTGGVGCDNMTITIVALLRGKTEKEWYDMIADRVAQGDGPCAPPEYADFKGPGVRSGQPSADDSDDLDNDERSRLHDLGGSNGRIIMLRDGTEVLTDSADQEDMEMSDASDDEESGATKKEPTSEAQRQREETPGPGHGAESQDSTASNSSSEGHNAGATQVTSESSPKVAHANHDQPVPDEPSMMAATDSVPAAKLKDVYGEKLTGSGQ